MCNVRVLYDVLCVRFTVGQIKVPGSHVCSHQGYIMHVSPNIQRKPKHVSIHVIISKLPIHLVVISLINSFMLRAQYIHENKRSCLSSLYGCIILKPLKYRPLSSIHKQLSRCFQKLQKANNTQRTLDKSDIIIIILSNASRDP